MRKKIFFVVIVMILAACAQSAPVSTVTTPSNQLREIKPPISTYTLFPTSSPTPPLPTSTPPPVERITFTTIQGPQGDTIISFVNSDGTGLVSPSLFEPFYEAADLTGVHLAWSPDGRFLAFDGADMITPCDFSGTDCFTTK